jgi:hypothetical protein
MTDRFLVTFYALDRPEPWLAELAGPSLDVSSVVRVRDPRLLLEEPLLAGRLELLEGLLQG